MNTQTVQLVKDSWKKVASMDHEMVGGLFYEKLFQLMPEVRPMFSRTPIRDQSRKLLSMLAYIISKLEAMDELIPEVSKLAQRHNSYDVQENHYVAVGNALLWTLEKGLGPDWNPALKSSWTEVYTALSGAMIAAQKTTSAQEQVY